MKSEKYPKVSTSRPSVRSKAGKDDESNDLSALSKDATDTNTITGAVHRDDCASKNDRIRPFCGFVGCVPTAIFNFFD